MESAEETLEARLGDRVRSLRRLRRATLKAVADRAGLSESFLSQVERGRASPSIGSLQRIAGALGVSVADLFGPDGDRPRPRPLRTEHRPTLPLGASGRKFLLTPRPLEHLEVFVAELRPGGSTAEEAFTHGDSEELVLVLSGTLHVQLADQVFALERGDSIDYASSTPHRAFNAGDEVVEALWIISPPSL